MKTQRRTIKLLSLFAVSCAAFAAAQGAVSQQEEPAVLPPRVGGREEGKVRNAEIGIDRKKSYNIRSTAQERKKAMTTGKALDGKPYAGNPHVRFDEGEVASCTAEASLRRVHCRRQPEGRASVCAATPRRGSLLYKVKPLNAVAAVIAVFCSFFTASAFAEAKSVTLSCSGCSGTTTLATFQALVKITEGKGSFTLPQMLGMRMSE